MSLARWPSQAILVGGIFLIEWSPATIKAFQTTLLAGLIMKGATCHGVMIMNYHIWVQRSCFNRRKFKRWSRTTSVSWWFNGRALAQAPESQLLKAWEGLGYYSRFATCNAVRANYWRITMVSTDGHWLTELIGIGHTAGAIASIAFNEPVPAVDGNAFRVFSRLLDWRWYCQTADPQLLRWLRSYS